MHYYTCDNDKMLSGIKLLKGREKEISKETYNYVFVLINYKFYAFYFSDSNHYSTREMGYILWRISDFSHGRMNVSFA